MKTDQSSIVHSINTDFKAKGGTGSLPSRPSPLSAKRTSRNTSPRVVVIREEFIALTGNPLIAVVLNQLLYWTQRVKDFDLLLEEEKSLLPEEHEPPLYGWIYKSADELIEETMLGVTRPTMRKYLMFLVDQGWAFERSNPHEGWNKPTQYRLNLRRLRADLQIRGYDLPGSIFPHANEVSSETQNDETPQVCSVEKNLTPVLRIFPSMLNNLTPVENNLTPYTYTEITTENTKKELTERARENQKSLGEEKRGELSHLPYLTHFLLKPWLSFGKST